MRVLQRFNEFLVTAGSWGTILFMAVIAVVIPYEVIGRYVFQKMTHLVRRGFDLFPRLGLDAGRRGGAEKGLHDQHDVGAGIGPPGHGQDC